MREQAEQVRGERRSRRLAECRPERQCGEHHQQCVGPRSRGGLQAERHAARDQRGGEEARGPAMIRAVRALRRVAAAKAAIESARNATADAPKTRVQPTSSR